ncbi:Xenotropic and polytropic retrovirus receptor 1, partial [Friedmanniomyces endolithicus]
MYCSQTYALGNISLFFCLYAQHWSNPAACNSSHSHLLGFFQAVPGIARLLQCVRRYYDTRLWTHGANGAKYTCTILQALSLSLWRIYGGDHLMAFYIACATLNSVYCSFWDLEYDWSMPLNPY